MKYKVTRSDFPIKVKLRPEDEQNNLVGILKGSAGFSTDVAGVVSLTQDPTDEEAAVMDFCRSWNRTGIYKIHVRRWTAQSNYSGYIHCNRE
jgi:hypothetical protein